MTDAERELREISDTVDALTVEARALNTKEVAAALAVLARTGRVLAVVIPRGIPHDKVMALKRDIDAKLDRLVAERGPLP